MMRFTQIDRVSGNIPLVTEEPSQPRTALYWHVRDETKPPREKHDGQEEGKLNRVEEQESLRFFPLGGRVSRGGAAQLARSRDRRSIPPLSSLCRIRRGRSYQRMYCNLVQ